MASSISSRKTRVVIIDDHPLVREGLKTLISREADMDVVGEADGVMSGIQLIHKERPDVAVVDISLKDGSGTELIKDMVTQYPKLCILASSMHDELVYAERVLRAGGKGYVHKQEGSQRIVEGIRRVREGRICVSEKVNDRLLARAAQQGGDVERSPVDELSDRELQVFQLIGEGHSSREIAERLELSPKTVDTHRQNIKLKLDLGNATELTHFATLWMMNEGNSSD